MTNFTGYSNRQKLEEAYKNSHEFSRPENQLVNRFKELGSWLVSFFGQGEEVRVWKSKDRLGNIYWNARDSARNISIRKVSEEELRAWLDTRYY